MTGEAGAGPAEKWGWEMILAVWIDTDGAVGWCGIPRSGVLRGPAVGLLPVGGVGALAGLLAGWTWSAARRAPSRVIVGGETDGLDVVRAWWSDRRTTWSIASGGDAFDAWEVFRWSAGGLAERLQGMLIRLDQDEGDPAARATALAWLAHTTE